MQQDLLSLRVVYASVLLVPAPVTQLTIASHSLTFSES